MCLVAKALTTSSRDSSISSPGSRPTSSTGIRPRSSRWMARSEQLDALDGLGRQVDRRRLHLHHPPPGDQDRQRGDVVEMRVADEPVRRGHERPGLAAQVEAQLQLGHPPVGLHGGPRVALDRQALVLERAHRGVVHRVVERFHGRFDFRRQTRSPQSGFQIPRTRCSTFHLRSPVGVPDGRCGL